MQTLHGGQEHDIIPVRPPVGSGLPRSVLEDVFSWTNVVDKLCTIPGIGCPQEMPKSDTAYDTLNLEPGQCEAGKCD